jgi:hypothetical protein
VTEIEYPLGVIVPARTVWPKKTIVPPLVLE